MEDLQSSDSVSAMSGSSAQNKAESRLSFRRSVSTPRSAHSTLTPRCPRHSCPFHMQSAFVFEGEIDKLVMEVRCTCAVVRSQDPSRSTPFRPRPDPSPCPIPLLAQVLENHLAGKQYEEDQVSHWINYICEDVVQALATLQKPFKYAGASSFTGGSWDVRVGVGERKGLSRTIILAHTPPSVAFF
jgi:hypothetical protein